MPTGNSTSGATNSSVYDHCNSYGTCAECKAGDPSAITLIGTQCGWCQLDATDGICSSGSSRGPTAVKGISQCDDWRFATCDAPPPPPPAPPACPINFDDSTCSGSIGGTCDTSSWTCNCRPGRQGDACEYDCNTLTVPNPEDGGKAVDIEGGGAAADKICQNQYGGNGGNSVHVSYSQGGCVSEASYMIKGGTSEHHWYNFGACVCHSLVNVVCTNPSPFCKAD